jgi:hypothetical protein
MTPPPAYQNAGPISSDKWDMGHDAGNLNGIGISPSMVDAGEGGRRVGG